MEQSASNKDIIQQWNINNTWTLFLDRDGVVNRHRIGSYIMMVDEFEFLPGVLQAFASANKHFTKIVIVSNQQGIGKGLMTSQTLDQIHEFMISEVKDNNGRIDKVYYSPHLADSNHIMRKPNTGMAMAAAKDFPDISFKRSVMIGDSVTDMEFARALGMKAVFVGIPEEMDVNKDLFDVAYPSFSDFIKDLNTIVVNQ